MRVAGGIVDAHQPVLERFGHADDAPKVARAQIRGQAVRGVVGARNDLLIGVEDHNRRHRPERLVARHRHLLLHVREHRGLVKEPRAVHTFGEPPAAGQRAGPTVDGIPHGPVHFFKRLGVDQGSHLHAGLRARPDLDRPHGLRELAEKRVGEGALHIHAIGADAGLAPHPQVLDGDGVGHGAVEVRVVEDDKGGIAAQLERDALELARRGGH